MGKRRRARRPEKSVEALMLEAARRPPPALEHAGEDDCPLCRKTAGQAPIEIITLPDGTIFEVHEMPGPGIPT